MFNLGRKAFLEKNAEKLVVEAIGKAESKTQAEIRVHLAHKVKKDVYTEAVATFRRLGLYKTEWRNAILIYVVPKEQKFAIVGDIGIHEKVKDIFWQQVRDAMTAAFAAGELADGIVKGIELAGEKLAEYFPLNGANPNELSDEISRS